MATGQLLPQQCVPLHHPLGVGPHLDPAAAPGHVCPGIRIQAIDMVQPPGIDISPIADMDSHPAIVSAALAAKSSAETPKKARSENHAS